MASAGASSTFLGTRHHRRPRPAEIPALTALYPETAATQPASISAIRREPYTLPMGHVSIPLNPATRALVTIDEIRAAAQRIPSVIVHTPMVRAPFEGISARGTGRQIYLKAESLQPIGSFKLRGASNKILQLTPEEIKRGVITYSSGNHAQGVAYAAREVGAKAVIVMPSNAPAIKKAATLALGAEIVEVGPASSERLAKAEAAHRAARLRRGPALRRRTHHRRPGHLRTRDLEALPDVDLVLSPVSGGGLLSGTATAIKLLSARRQGLRHRTRARCRRRRELPHGLARHLAC